MINNENNNMKSVEEVLSEVSQDIMRTSISLTQRIEEVRNKYRSIPLDYNESINEQIKLNWRPNMVDKCKFYIPKKYLPKDRKFKPGRCPFMEWGYDNCNSRNGTYHPPYIIFSGKITSKPWFLGGIYKGNVQEVVDYIEEKIGIKIPVSEFVKIRVLWLDIKQDMMFPIEDQLFVMIKTMKKMIDTHADKVKIVEYKSKIGITNSILATSTSQEVEDSVTSYGKLNEMEEHRDNDHGYYDSFDEEFLETICSNIIRIERRLMGKYNLIKALKLDKTETVSLQKVFDCNFNLLEDVVRRYMDIHWEKPITPLYRKLPQNISEYIKEVGRECISNECDNNITLIKEYLEELYPDKDISNELKKFKELLKSKEMEHPILRKKVIDLLGLNFRIYGN